MYNPIKKSREHLAAKKAAVEYDQQVRKITKLNLLAEQKAEMLQKPCPFLGMHNCLDSCVHFSEGFLSPMPSLRGSGEIYFMATRPKCKLWGK